ncbi:MAG: transcriptional repressor [Prevotella sp.]|nr:transcriptional repressor [Prevotella sp.]
MDSNEKDRVKAQFTEYLQTNHRRKTPERYAILDAAYDMDALFSLDDLNLLLEEKHFRVSMATLYNTVNLLVKAQLLVRHKMEQQTLYEAEHSFGHCYQKCSICGKTKAISKKDVVPVVENMKLRWFKKHDFSLIVFGICGSCQNKMKKNKLANKK